MLMLITVLNDGTLIAIGYGMYVCVHMCVRVCACVSYVCARLCVCDCSTTARSSRSAAVRARACVCDAHTTRHADRVIPQHHM